MKNRCLNCNELLNVWHNKRQKVLFNLNLFRRPDVHVQRAETKLAKIYTFPLNIQVICVLSVPFATTYHNRNAHIRDFPEWKKEGKFYAKASIKHSENGEKNSNKLYHVWNFSFLVLFYYFSSSSPSFFHFSHFGEPLKPHSIEYEKISRTLKFSH